MLDKHKDYPFPQYRFDHHSFSILRNWHGYLESNRSERAALRRAAHLTEIMCSPPFHRLLRALRDAGYGISEVRYAKIAVIAGLCARVREETNDGLAKRMGTPKPGSDKAVVSELRMRRVLACDDLEELYILLRRALSLLDDSVNLADLAAVVWNWTPMDEKRAYDPRRKMAYDYYAEAPL